LGKFGDGKSGTDGTYPVFSRGRNIPSVPEFVQSLIKMNKSKQAIRPATTSHHFECLNPAIVVSATAANGRLRNVSLPVFDRKNGMASNTPGARNNIPRKIVKQKTPTQPNRLRDI
jgi:hypothetical protein